MKINLNSFRIFVVVLCISSNSLLSQNNYSTLKIENSHTSHNFIGDNENQFQIHLSTYVLFTHPRRKNTSPDPFRLGGGIDVDFQFSSRVGLLVQIQGTSDHFLGLHAPLFFSPRFVVQKNDKSRTFIHAGIGPAFSIGGDIGPFTKVINIGVRREIRLGSNRKNLAIGLSYRQSQAFDPKTFHYIDLLIGIRFF